MVEKNILNKNESTNSESSDSEDDTKSNKKKRRRRSLSDEVRKNTLTIYSNL